MGKNKTFMAYLVVFFALAIAVFMYCFTVESACAETFVKNMLYFTQEGVNTSEMKKEEIPEQAIVMQQVNNKWYVFLPGNQNTEKIQVWFTGIDEVTINEKEYKNGDYCDLNLEQNNSVKIGKKKYSLTVMQGSSIPSVQIITETGSMKKINSKKTYKEGGNLILKNGAGTVEYNGDLEHIKLRGNTSAHFKKRGYQIKLATKTDILGMGKAKKWILTGNYIDNSLLRNQITFAMADYVGLPYTPECVQVDLYLNHEYNGTYILQEKVEIGKNRVNINDLQKKTEEVNDEPLSSYKNLGAKKLTTGKYKYMNIPNDPDDITGGYLIEYENWSVRYSDELCAYGTKKGKSIMIKEPEYASQAQMEYISTFIQGYENAIFSDDGIDPKTGKHYSEFIDKESLILKYMLEEISKNIDGNQSSQYYYKPADSESMVAFAGPAWDYDCTYGAYANKESQKSYLNATGFAHNKQSTSNYWWPELYKKEDFKAGVCEMWNERYTKAIEILLGEREPEGNIKSIEEYKKAIEYSAKMNFVRFPISKYENTSNLAKCGLSFDENVEYLREYIRKRRDFLDEYWGQTETVQSVNDP